MNTSSDTLIFATGVMFTIAIMLCWRTKKVTDEAIKVLREKR